MNRIQIASAKRRPRSNAAMTAVFAIFCTLASPQSPAAAGEAGTLTVRLAGFEEERGTVLVSLLRGESEFDGAGEGFRVERVKVAGDRAIAIFSELPSGEYAIKVFHDANDNEKLDTNFVGFPKEKFGFSNDAMGKFGPPDYGQAKFDFEGPEATLEIQMK